MMAIAFSFFAIAAFLTGFVVLQSIFGTRMEDRWREAVLNLIMLQIIATLIVGGAILSNMPK